MQNLVIETDGPVRIITINRPEVRNAVDGPTAALLAEAFRAFEQDELVSVAVLTGASGTFCAGADLKALSQGAGLDVKSLSQWKGNSLSEEGDGPMGPTRMTLKKPVLAAVEGFAVAGGLELALWCDLRIAAKDATFGVFCRRFGVPLIDGGTIRLPRLIGLSHALDLILTGRPVSGEEALRMGLANRLVAPGEARSAAVKMAYELSRFPQLCMRADRESAYEQASLSLEEALRREFRGGRDVIASGETTQGAGRFASGEGRHGAFSPPETE